MTHLLQLLGYACVLGAAIIVGNWFLSEMRRAGADGRPWYKVYFCTPPGILILILLIGLPFLYVFF